MGIITGAKILTSASPTMASPTVTNLSTTTLTASGTGTGFFVQRIDYPAATTSTNFANSDIGDQALAWLQPLGVVTDTLPTGGSSMPYVSAGAAAGGTFTVKAAVGSSSVIACDMLFINY